MMSPSLRNLTISPTQCRPTRRRCRERVSTAFIACVALVPLLACGGSAKKGSYQRAIGKQEQCCQGLQDDRQRAECMDSIVRVGDESAEDHDINEATFRCVERSFVCEPQTGRATQEASQEAFDCISDLGS